ncbi:hypothetical protein TeGR_g10890 [Tetraparma gracilis]|uniref:Uncharacterized protein n=1 Tax=Tetraparma gracilis TaxID=2962635 RepID=A0ABQ6MHR0_9STRA|nr:hypothetical protein TeGR_g10890 [Tetraparma gracilis]
MLGLKLDLYQPKYANMTMVWTVTKCPPENAVVGPYGVGTKFSAMNILMKEEILEVTECTFVKGEMGKVVFRARGIDAIYITKALPNGDCEYTLAQDGPKMGSEVFANAMAMQLRTMKAFVEANAAAISAEAPLDQLVEVAEHGAAQNIMANSIAGQLAKANAQVVANAAYNGARSGAYHSSH